MIWYMIWYDMIYMIHDMIYGIYVIGCDMIYDMTWHDMIWYDIFLTAIGLTPGGNSTIHIYKQTIHRTTQLTKWEECCPCPVFASYTLAFALQLRKRHGKSSVRVAEECQLARWKQNVKKRTYITIGIQCVSIFKQVYTGNHSEVDTFSYYIFSDNERQYHLLQHWPFLVNDPAYFL